MYQLILKAEEIPDGTQVYKVGGSKQYTLQTQIAVYAYLQNTPKDAAPKQMQLGPNLRFMIPQASTDAFNVVDKDMLLKVEFDTIDELKDFVDDICDGVENSK